MQDTVYEIDITAISKPSPKANSSNPVKLVYIIKSTRRLIHKKPKHTEERKQTPHDLKNSLTEFRINKIASAAPGNAGKI